MNILAISYFLPPYLYAQSIVIGRLLYYLAKNQHSNIFVVTAQEKSSVFKTQIYENFFDVFKKIIKVPYYYNRYEDKIKTIILPLIYSTPDIHKFWNNLAFNKIKKELKDIKFDLIITFSSPQSTHLLGLKLKEYFNASWIAHLSDPWVENPYYNFKFLVKRINEVLEKKVFFSADKLIFTCQETKDLYVKKYPQIKNKFYVLEHSYEPLFCLNEVKYIKRDYLLLRYLGNFSKIRTPEYFFKGIKLLIEEEPKTIDILRFEIFGGHRIVNKLIDRYKLNNCVKIIPFVEYKESLTLMQEADILVVIDANLKYNPFLPSKLIEYLGAKRPILGITPEGASARIIKEAGGWVIFPEDTQGIKNTLIRIIQLWKEDKLNNYIPPQEVCERYKIENKTKEFEKIILQ
ncbi:MAG: hypothetical protein QXZ20_02400 [Candidatus Aenigmatarchaeota archaeon]